MDDKNNMEINEDFSEIVPDAVLEFQYKEILAYENSFKVLVTIDGEEYQFLQA